MQTEGRGRRGREWESPAGCNLYFSLLLRPTVAKDKASMLTLLMAYAVYKAVDMCLKEETSSKDASGADLSVAPCGIKWPNDVVVNGKKVCGILTEMQIEGNGDYYVIIGVGINVGKQEFPPELADKATSLADVCPKEILRIPLLADILKNFEEEYEGFCRAQNLEAFREKYNQCLVNRNRQVCVLDPKGEYRGTALGINDSGELLVEREGDTVETVYAGEVSVRGIYGYV